MREKENIAAGKTYLGIEFGSTRIKACLIDETYAPIAEGSHEWENRLENGVWTYTLDDVKTGLQSCYAALKKDIITKYDVVPTSYKAIGISAMMHGYLAFDKDYNQLAEFRTWRNTMTAEAAEKLTKLFGCNIPQRWSIAHLYHAILNGEEHVKQIAHITTLAGYVHYLLTGENVLGAGDASGMFPIEYYCSYNSKMMAEFMKLPEVQDCGWHLNSILPLIKSAGEKGGELTPAGAKLLDPDGDLVGGIAMCPPEGDAGTGMTATNSVRGGTGNISAGTSVFSMLVLEEGESLSGCYQEIDTVATPDGKEVAMVHCNNCCGEIDAWVNMFIEFSELMGKALSKSEAYELLYKNALNGSADCGGITAYNCISGEPVSGVSKGRPMYMRSPDSRMKLADFIRAQLYGTIAALKMGNDILFEREKISSASFTAHGGLFKVQGTAQQFAADALGSKVSVMSTAGEGGAWGMALLAAYSVTGEGSLADWLDEKVFSGMKKYTVEPDQAGMNGWKKYMEIYKAGLAAEKAAGEI